MTKNEIIFLCYGYIKADSASNGNAENIVEILEDHLFPKERIELTGTSEPLDFGDDTKETRSPEQ